MTSCYNSCNLPCQQIYLQQTVTPTNVSAGQSTQWQFIVTNISGNNIAGPIVISSSLAGTLLVTANTMASGATVTVNANYTVPSTTPNNSVLTSVAFVAQGISTGTPGNYAVGTRYSKIVTTSVNVRNTIGGAIVQVSGTGTFVPNSFGNVNTSLSLIISNQGVIGVPIFSMNLNDYFRTCATGGAYPFGLRVSGTNANMFQLTNFTTLTMISGNVLAPGQTYTISVEAGNCVSPCIVTSTCTAQNNCRFFYQYQVNSGALIVTGEANINYQRC